MMLGETETYSGNGPDNDNIIIDVWESIMASSQPQLKVDYQQVTMSRSWAELIRLDNACVMNRIITAQRLEIAEFSMYPLSVFPPIRLIILEQNSDSFTSPLSFEQLSADPGIKLGVVKARTYGLELDEELSTYPQQIFTRGGVDSSDKLVEMLLAGRVDGILDYTRSVEDYLIDDNRGVKIRALPIQDIFEPMLGYIACSKTAKGIAIIDAINHSFSTPGFSDSFIELHLNYFGENEAKLLKPTLESIFSYAQ